MIGYGRSDKPADFVYTMEAWGEVMPISPFLFFWHESSPFKVLHHDWNVSQRYLPFTRILTVLPTVTMCTEAVLLNTRLKRFPLPKLCLRLKLGSVRVLLATACSFLRQSLEFVSVGSLFFPADVFPLFSFYPPALVLYLQELLCFSESKRRPELNES